MRNPSVLSLMPNIQGLIERQHFYRKPIYPTKKSLPPLIETPQSPASSTPSASSSSIPPTSTSTDPRPTPTDRLAHQICRARQLLQVYASTAEDRANGLLSRALESERTFTGTIASLAPPPQSNEHLLPGTMYVLVAGMGGSILSRNRGLFLRTATPLTVGLGAAYVVLPITMRNVGDLVWSWEVNRAPGWAAGHMRIRGAVEQGWKEAQDRLEGSKRWGIQKVQASREAVEGWVKNAR